MITSEQKVFDRWFYESQLKLEQLSLKLFAQTGNEEFKNQADEFHLRSLEIKKDL